MLKRGCKWGFLERLFRCPSSLIYFRALPRSPVLVFFWTGWRVKKTDSNREMRQKKGMAPPTVKAEMERRATEALSGRLWSRSVCGWCGLSKGVIRSPLCVGAQFLPLFQGGARTGEESVLLERLHHRIESHRSFRDLLRVPRFPLQFPKTPSCILHGQEGWWCPGTVCRRQRGFFGKSSLVGHRGLKGSGGLRLSSWWAEIHKN